MLLTARFLKDCQGVNSYEADTEILWTEGDSVDMYFQLIDDSLDRPHQGFTPSGRRYVPAVGATLTVTLENLDDAKVLTRPAVQPFAQDGSIWKITIIPTDPIRGTPQMRLALVEGSKLTGGTVKYGVKIFPKSGL
jgi:hypothetical protein